MARYLDMFFHAVDGNFHASQKMKPMDPTDFSLTNGAGYFVEQSDFNIYRDAVKPPKKEVRIHLANRFPYRSRQRTGNDVS